MRRWGVVALVVWACGTTVDSGVDAVVDADGDGFTADVDCDDADPARFPGAPELCDDIDDDCDGDAASAGAATFFPGAAAADAVDSVQGLVREPDADGAHLLDEPGVLRLCGGEHAASLRITSDGVVVVGRSTGALPQLSRDEGPVLDVADGITTSVTGLALRGGDAATVVVGEDATVRMVDVHTLGGGGRAYDVRPTGHLALERGRVSGYDHDRGAGVLLGQGASLEARGSVFEDLTAQAGGAAVFAGADTTVRLRDVVARRLSGGGGGALLRASGSDELSLEGVVVDGASAGRGGVVDIVGALEVLVLQSTLSNVSATDGDGGALRLQDVGFADLFLTSIDGASASGDGGAIRWSGPGTVDLKHIDILGAEAGGDGGGIWVEEATGLWSDLEVSDASARDGGAMALIDTRVRVLGGVFEDDTASRRGGALSILGGDNLVLAARVTGAEADQGGAVYAGGDGVLVLADGRFEDNRAARGAGLSLGPSFFTLEYGTWTGNVASIEGGFAFVDTGGWLGLDWTIVEDNTAPRGGGISISGVGTENYATLLEAELRRNVATGADGGGGVYIGDGVLSHDRTNYGLDADANTPDDISTADGITVDAGSGYSQQCDREGCQPPEASQ